MVSNVEKWVFCGRGGVGDLELVRFDVWCCLTLFREPRSQADCVYLAICTF